MFQVKESSNAFRDFLVNELERRDMSNRQFAEFVGVSNATINRAIDPRDPAPPTLDFLTKVSKATGLSIVSLVRLAYPDVVETSGLSASDELLAQRINKLPEGSPLREAIEAIIRGSSE